MMDETQAEQQPEGAAPDTRPSLADLQAENEELRRQLAERQQDAGGGDEDLDEDEEDDDEDDEDGERRPLPPVKTFEDRLRRIATWTARTKGLAKDSALDMGNVTMEIFGPDARRGQFDYHNGNWDALAATLRNAKENIAEVAKDAKEAAKADKAVADAADFVLQAIEVHYADVLTGQSRQTTIDQVRDGRHKESRLPPEAPAAPTVPPLLPWQRLRVWRPDGSEIEGEDRITHLLRWRAGEDQVGLLVPPGRIDEDGRVVRMQDDDSTTAADLIDADKAALIKDGDGTERIVLCAPADVDWTGFPPCRAPADVPGYGAGTVDAAATTWRAVGRQVAEYIAEDYGTLTADELPGAVLRDLLTADGCDSVADNMTPAEISEFRAGLEDGLREQEAALEATAAGPKEEATGPGLSAAQRQEAQKRGLSPEQITSVDAALRADPKISQVQLSKVTGVERTKIQRILKAEG